MTRRALNSALANFLGTFVSRYSDYHGYWLLGFLTEALHEGLRVDLLRPSDRAPTTPLDTAMLAASAKFRDQVLKAGLSLTQVAEAHLLILPTSNITGYVNGSLASGFLVDFQVTAVTDTGRQYKVSRSTFVALHNPNLERRSSRYLGASGLSLGTYEVTQARDSSGGAA